MLDGLPRLPGDVILPVPVWSTVRDCFGLVLRFGVILVSPTCRLSRADAVLECEVELPESDAALILRELTGMREVAGGLLPDTGDAMVSARREVCGRSLLVRR